MNYELRLEVDNSTSSRLGFRLIVALILIFIFLFLIAIDKKEKGKKETKVTKPCPTFICLIACEL